VRTSTRFYVAALVVWAVLALSGSRVIPGAVAVIVAAVLAALAFLSDFRRVRWPVWAVLFAGLTLASVLWSQDTEVARDAAAALVVVTLTAGVPAAYMDRDRFLHWLNLAFKTALVASLAAGVLLPSFGVESRWPNVGALTGLFVHKNLLGSVLVLGIITLIYTQRKRLWLWLGLYAVGVVMTRSSTAVVLAVVAVLLWWLLGALGRRGDRDRRLGVLAAAAGLVVLSIIVLQFQVELLDVVGRDLTLGGRARMWDAIVTVWGAEPALGYGWGSAFSPQSTSAVEIASVMGWVVPSAHSGYLSVLLQLGVVGLAVFAVFVLQTAGRAFRGFVATPTPFTMWALQITVAYVIMNVFDTRVDGLEWFLFVAAAAYMLQVKRRQPDTTARVPATRQTA